MGVFFAACRLQAGDESTLLDTVEKLTAFLAGIPAKYLDRLSHDLVLLYFTWLFSRKMIEKSAYIPQLVQLTDRSFAVRYIPAHSNEKVKEIFNRLTGACPPDLVIIVITSYGMARSDLEILSKHTWKTIVIDEAQNIKNVSAAQTQAVKKLKADIRIAMSGTPVENRLSEYWSIFDFTFKGYLGGLKQFTDKYAAPIEMNRDRKVLRHFLKVTSPFILRRLKTDKTIISDLPEKMEQDYHAFLTKEQAAIYQNVLDHIMAEIEAVDETDQNNRMKRKGLVLTLIMALKQICNHPSQYLKKQDASPDLSGKASLFMNLLENILENNEKVLVFTQFREMGDIIRKMIKARLDMDAMFLHGGTSRKHRDEMVSRFQESPHEKIFILSIKAGGTGLNLTAASHVIHYDLWWNPAVENQATDRAYRIGQHQNVMVYRMITKGTFEEKINAMLRSKKELADLSISIGEQWVGNLSNRELRKVFAKE